MIILTIDDTLFTDGPILQFVASSRGIAALIAMASHAHSGGRPALTQVTAVSDEECGY